MNNKQEDNVGKNAIQIKPAKINLTQDANTQSDAPVKTKIPTGPLLWVGIIFLCVILGAVIILTNRSEPPATTDALQQGTDNKPHTATTVSAPPVVKIVPTDSSPWDEAQQTKLRKETQDILAELLEMQETLEVKDVKQWASEEYGLVIQHAESGDKAYRQQQFKQAKSDYQLALTTLKGLFNRTDSILNNALTRGNEALVAGDSVLALEAFQLALIIEPDNETARNGSERAKTLDEVMALNAEADIHFKNGQLNDAKEKYEQALTLDSNAEHAGKQLKQVKQRILDEKFNQLMSTGYASLVSNQLEEARKAFQRALKLKPDASEAQNALSQTKNRITTEEIKMLLSETNEFEGFENWQQAIAKYAEALAVDSNLAQAIQGRENAVWRAELDKRLNQTIAYPERLSDKAVYNEAVNLQRDAFSIEGAGPKLSQQISSLSSLLKKASTPVKVTLQSNNATKVTLYKVGEMGLFETRVLSLLPGRYVVVGNREGYRDVRVEFRVSPDSPTASVIIQCNEKISL